MTRGGPCGTRGGRARYPVGAHAPRPPAALPYRPGRAAAQRSRSGWRRPSASASSPARPCCRRAGSPAASARRSHQAHRSTWCSQTASRPALQTAQPPGEPASLPEGQQMGDAPAEQPEVGGAGGAGGAGAAAEEPAGAVAAARGRGTPSAHRALLGGQRHAHRPPGFAAPARVPGACRPARWGLALQRQRLPLAAGGGGRAGRSCAASGRSIRCSAWSWSWP